MLPGVVGIKRQFLCNAIKRFNAEGLGGLYDHPKGHRKPVLGEDEEAAVIARILHRADRGKDETSTWTLPDLCRFIEERFDKHMRPQSMSQVVRRLGLSRQKTRLIHPQSNSKAAEAFEEGGFLRSWRRPPPPHPGKCIALSFRSAARRVKTKCGWARRAGPCTLVDPGRASAFIFAAVRPATGEDFALAIPHVSAA